MRGAYHTCQGCPSWERRMLENPITFLSLDIVSFVHAGIPKKSLALSSKLFYSLSLIFTIYAYADL